MYDFEQLDSYELLGVTRSAPPEEIKRAYRQEIAKYHPDRWSSASPNEQEYARKRASAITEAYSLTQKDKPVRRATPSAAATPEPVGNPERLAQLYEHGRSLLAANDFAGAANIFRQIQNADPFYRDSADLLYRAEFALKRNQPAKAKRPVNKKAVAIIGGSVGVAALIGAVWVFGGSNTNATNPNVTATALIAVELPTVTVEGEVASNPTATSDEGVVVEPTLEPTLEATSEPTAEPTLEPSPTSEPTVEPTLEPSPTSEPTAAPSNTPAPLPDDLSGPILVTDNLDGGTWPVGNGGNWNFEFINGRYHMTMVAGVGSVWSFGPALPAQNVVLAVDVEAVSGSGGLMMGFIDGNNYYRFIIAADGTWAFQQRFAAQTTLLASGSGLGPGRLVIAQRGAVTHLYWNDTYLGEVVLPAFPGGAYGFVLAGNSSADVYFDNLRLRALP
ncbi:DnaJ domain-containing protein [Herpetosiphon sp.]|uniref:Heat shock protein DnaJ domain protein n=1 Tax=Herpetosiphon aurantiacus (strain ATCC 23779 / DSM 785 / 114-95) TaxID=316274 RepID=A9B3F0_HERA2|nr:DnaJ domain-containing protein [Herpetosiphon sp.]ABX04113.1 heat shock protein DnaJ domain protein [Herpetosiphon aurantiacus DSM 785]